MSTFRRPFIVMTKPALCLALFLSAAGVRAADAPTSEWVRVGTDGKLVYKADAHGNRIPDFSNVGYRGGGESIPEVPVRAAVEPGVGDATARIQAAIDAVSRLPADAAGRRGAVLLKKGRYPIAGTLRLHTGGVVLRGEGQGDDGTTIVAAGATQRSLIVAGGTAGRAPRNEDDDTSEPSTAGAGGQHWAVADDYVPVGARRLHVDRADGLRVGSEIVIRRPSTAEWIHDLGMDQIPPKSTPVTQWKPGSKDLIFHRTITAVAGDEISIDAPIVNALEKKYGGAEISLAGPGRAVREVGVENLRGDSDFTSETDEKHGWVLVEFAAVRDGWVRDVTAIHFGYSCVNVLRASRAITIDRCTCLDPVSQITGGRRYSFALDGELTLVQHCRARNGRHDFVMHSTAAGPNVFFDCVAEDVHADSGPHHRWSVGVLYDNVTVKPPRDAKNPKGIGLNIRNRGNSGTGHGWAGANQVAWNCDAYEMKIEQPPTAQNWAIGCRAVVHEGDGYWESFGKPVGLKSLYAAQLRERLGH